MATIKAIIPGCPHTFELRNCKEVMGHDDTLPFNADIYLNGKRIGSAWNTGWGGDSEYRLGNDITESDKTALKEVEDTIAGIQLLKEFNDTKWRLHDLLDFMAEEAVCCRARTFTVRPQ